LAAFIRWAGALRRRPIQRPANSTGITPTLRSFKKAFDAWWLDTDEPETEGREDNILVDHQLALGSGARYANVFPNFHTGGVSDGQRAASDEKRVFILSRSAYAGRSATA
jgi:alpha-D-xyloside xylohydrolase